MAQDHRRGTGRSVQSWVTNDDESIDLDQLEDTIKGFQQELMQMAANKNNLKVFKDVSRSCTFSPLLFTLKQLVDAFVRKRTEVVIKINKVTKSMPANDMKLYKMTEQFRLRVKDAEVKARNHCARTQQEKGSQIRLVEFFDESIKKYEFQLGLTPGIIDESLVREN